MTSAVTTQLMIVLDMTIIAVALPDMQESLNMTAAERPWVSPPTPSPSEASCSSAGG